MKKFLFKNWLTVVLMLVGVLLFTTGCITEADRYSPALKRVVIEDLWQPIPTSVGYSANDLLLIILKRQEIINQKLDQILEKIE